MTGFGNNALNALIVNSEVELVGVFTPKRQQGPFPYYPCKPLYQLVENSGTPLFEGYSLKEKSCQELIISLRPEIIVVATYDQIVPRPIIALPHRGVINIHPSLLPKYRGPIPTVCALLNGERRTGVTAHFIEDERIDAGRIITQAILDVEPGDNDGSLRRKLGLIAEQVLTTAISLVRSKDMATFRTQQGSDATYCQKRSTISSEIDIRKPFDIIVNTIRALTPYPGAYLTVGENRYLVTGAALLDQKTGRKQQAHGTDSIEITTVHGRIKFALKKESQS